MDYGWPLILPHISKETREALGDAPAGMIEPHLHHILFKNGVGIKQQKEVIRGMEVLVKHNINIGANKANLVWAPNIKGQHVIDKLTEVVDAIVKADKVGSTLSESKELVIAALTEMGEQAAKHTKP